MKQISAKVSLISFYVDSHLCLTSKNVSNFQEHSKQTKVTKCLKDTSIHRKR